MSQYEIYFDGACEPKNPGGVATAGWLIYLDGKKLTEGCKVVKEGAGATNNVAEWCALGFALRWLLDHHTEQCCGHTLMIHGDSQLVCFQLTGRWQCNASHLQKFKARCLEYLERLKFSKWDTGWVRREENQEADDLSKKAYREHTGREPPEPRRRW